LGTLAAQSAAAIRGVTVPQTLIACCYLDTDTILRFWPPIVGVAVTTPTQVILVKKWAADRSAAHLCFQ
jgi:hypothetical protein